MLQALCAHALPSPLVRRGEQSAAEWLICALGNADDGADLLLRLCCRSVQLLRASVRDHAQPVGPLPSQYALASSVQQVFLVAPGACLLLRSCVTPQLLQHQFPCSCSHARMCMPAPRCLPSKYACAETECTRNSNPRLANPDGLIVGTDTVDVGPVYAVQKGDTLLSIAAMARTTIKSILHVNSDLAVSTHRDLQPGHDICLLLCTSVPLA
jgi:hypothetical protein